MNKKPATLRWLLTKIKPRIPALVALTLTSVGSSLLGVLFALGSKGVIDAATAGNRSQFYRACLLQAAIILGTLICLTLVRHLKERIHANLDRDWKKRLLHGLLGGEYKAVSAFHSGELINRLSNDVRILDDGIVNLLPNLASMITKLISAFVVLSGLAPLFALALLGAGLFVLLLTGLVRRRLKGMHKRVSEADGKVASMIQEALEKLLMVQAMDVSAEMERRVGAQLDHRFAVQQKRKNVSLLANTFISVMFYGAGFVALVWSAAGLLKGTLTFGTLTSITLLVNQLQSPMVGLSGVIPQYIAMTAAAERICELDNLAPEAEPMQEDPHALMRRIESFEAEQLVFEYDRDRIFDGASFSLPKDSFSVITGPSGVGKSTLLKLMLGVFTPQSGNLQLCCSDGNVPLNRSTRRLFAYVPQGNLLFSGTVRENLLVVKPDATDEEMAQAIYVSAMDDYLPQLPQGLDTLLGESGAGLSEGQAQRLAIARAVLGGAPVLLLDECTSALDVETELRVLQRLRQLQGKTCIAVTHRPAAVTFADWDIHLQAGKIQVRKIENAH